MAHKLKCIYIELKTIKPEHGGGLMYTYKKAMFILNS